MKYFSEWKNSWEDLFNNLKLLVPDVLFIIFEILFAGLILWITGLFPLVKTIYLEKDLSVIGNSLVKVIISAVIFIVTSFVLGAGVRAIKYNYICDVLKKKKVDLKKLWEYSGEGFLKIIYARIFLFLIAVVLFGIVGLLTLISEYFFLLMFIVSVIYIFGILFIYPIMFLKNKDAVDSIKSSFNYFRSHILHVLIVWLIISVTSVIFVNILPKLTSNNIVVIPLNFLIGLFVGMWGLLYLFKSL